MKKQDILISAAIIVAALACTLALTQRKGYIAFSTPGAQLHLRGVLFGQTVTSAPQPIEVPARTYRVSGLTLTANQEGQTWRITSQGYLGRVRVQPGATVTVDRYGPPFEIVPQVSVHQGVAHVDFQILGRGGERYNKIITKNGQSVPAPHVKVLDEQGKVLAAGQFTYG